jgi:hypothetical protein
MVLYWYEVSTTLKTMSSTRTNPPRPNKTGKVICPSASTDPPPNPYRGVPGVPARILRAPSHRRPDWRGYCWASLINEDLMQLHPVDVCWDHESIFMWVEGRIAFLHLERDGHDGIHQKLGRRHVHDVMHFTDAQASLSLRIQQTGWPFGDREDNPMRPHDMLSRVATSIFNGPEETPLPGVSDDGRMYAGGWGHMGGGTLGEAPRREPCVARASQTLTTSMRCRWIGLRILSGTPLWYVLSGPCVWCRRVLTHSDRVRVLVPP